MITLFVIEDKMYNYFVISLQLCDRRQIINVQIFLNQIRNKIATYQKDFKVWVFF